LQNYGSIIIKGSSQAASQAVLVPLAIIMDGASIAERFLDFCHPHKVLDQRGAEEVAKLCEVGKTFLWNRAKNVVRAAEDRAILYSYGSDSTPVLATSTVSQQLNPTRRIVRKAGVGTELLIERAFVKTTSASGSPVVVCLFRDPTPLTHGKTVWHHFSAACKFFPFLRTLGHEGIIVSHYCFDRAVFQAARRRFQQRHKLYYITHRGDSDMAGKMVLLELLDWDVSTGCAAHDCQNALQWALKSLCRDEADTVKRLWVSISALRNSYDLLHRYMPAFISQKLHVSEEPYDQHSVYSFWVTLGVDSEVADILAAMNLHCAGGKLCVTVSNQSLGDIQERIATAMLAVFRFKQFTDSRWITVGDSCRSLMASLALGLQGLVEFIRAEPSASDFHIHGFEQLNVEALRYSAIASIAANACDAVLLELLEDDRLGKRLPEVEEKLQEELSWIASIEPFVWQRLASFVPGLTSATLKNDCIWAANISASFMERKALSVARGLPWSLARGDMNSNLDQLLHGPPPVDPTAQKIKKLLELGYSRRLLMEGLDRLGDVHWSTTIVEQGHGSASVIHKAHRFYGVEMLCQRSMIHMMRSLFPTQAEEVASQRLENRLDALGRKQPQKITGRHVFLAECMELAAAGPVEHRGPRGQSIMRLHGSLWNALGEADKRRYDTRASQLAQERREELEEKAASIAAVQAARSLSADTLDAAGQLRLSNCRFDGAELEGLATLYSTSEFSIRNVQRLRALAMQAPVVPEAGVRAQLEEIDLPVEVEKLPCPPWLRTLCWARVSFRSTALVFARGDEEHVFAFLYATQSPLAASFLPLQRRRSTITASSSATRAEVLEASRMHFDHDFICRWGHTVTEEELPPMGSEDIYVLPDLAFLGQARVASHAALVQIDEFFKGLDLKVRGPNKRKTPASSERPDLEKLQAQYEYLSSYLAPGAGEAEGGASSSVARPDDSEASDEELEQEVWQQLANKRAEWQAQAVDAPVYFKTSLRCGVHVDTWGGRFDAVRAHAAKQEAQAWCGRYGLLPQRQLSLTKFGESAAHALALYWCRVMEYYYTLALAVNRPRYVYTEADHAARPSSEQAMSALQGLPPKHVAFTHLRQIEALRPSAPK
jgi:hypothetical protein